MIAWMRQQSAGTADFVMCSMMNVLQWRLRGQVCSKEDFDRYTLEYEPLTKQEFFPSSPMEDLQETAEGITWKSPAPTGFPENDRAQALLFFAPEKWNAPTVIILHALMSASDFGYRRWAATLNKAGWNAVFLHLPFHYSRKPKGHFNGELALTANLVRNGMAIRQAVIEVRQLLRFFEARGCKKFGMWGTSYGGWIGALTLALEKEFHFACLMQPIVSVDYALWESPASLVMRRLVLPKGILPQDVSRHAHLISPLHTDLAMDAKRVLIFGGSFDTVSPVKELQKLHARWQGSRLQVVPQGHFGYAVMNEAYRATLPFLDS